MNGNVFYMDWEVSLIEWLQKNLGDAGIAVSKVITAIGGETIAMLVLIVVLFCYSKEAGKRVGLTLLSANAWYPMIKNVVLRLRPYMVHENISVHQLVEADVSPTDVLARGIHFPAGTARLRPACTEALPGKSGKNGCGSWQSSCPC